MVHKQTTAGRVRKVFDERREIIHMRERKKEKKRKKNPSEKKGKKQPPVTKQKIKRILCMR